MMRPQPGGSEFEVSPIDSQSVQVEHWHAIFAETVLWYNKLNELGAMSMIVNSIHH